jgi:hypothetical protein
MKMNKVTRLSFAVLISICVGSAVGFVITALSSPGLYTDARFILRFALSTVPVWTIFYLVVPIFVLTIWYLRSGRLSLALSILAPTVWLFLTFLWWAYKPWRYYGAFPWHGFTRHFLSLLPVSLSAGWLFWKTLSPNQRVEASVNSPGSLQVECPPPHPCR